MGERLQGEAREPGTKDGRSLCAAGSSLGGLLVWL